MSRNPALRPRTGVYRGFFGEGTSEPGVHWSNKVRFDKIAERMQRFPDRTHGRHEKDAYRSRWCGQRGSNPHR